MLSECHFQEGARSTAVPATFDDDLRNPHNNPATNTFILQRRSEYVRYVHTVKVQSCSEWFEPQLISIAKEKLSHQMSQSSLATPDESSSSTNMNGPGRHGVDGLRI